ncbi:hypothetical protein [Ammoniphilus resinae]|nr:hypothetical protein [Ammoniphilus resinae]
MLYARYGENKLKVKSTDYSKEVHGDAICPFCDGKMTWRRGKTPHFMVAERKTHTCQYFSNYLNRLCYQFPRNTVDLRRGSDGSPIFNLEFEGETKIKKNSKGERDVKTKLDGQEVLPSVIQGLKQSSISTTKLKTNFKFIHDIYDFIRANERDQVLNCTFIVKGKKIKGEELLPKFSDILDLHANNKLHEMNRFLVGRILDVRIFGTGTIQVTLKGEKMSGSFVNPKIIIKKDVIQKLALDETDFRKNRFIMFYGKPSINEKREIIAFVNKPEDFEFGKISAIDGDFVDSLEEMHIDNYFNHQGIRHYIPTINNGKDLFSVCAGEDHFYVPDWILYTGTIIIVEYFGFYTEEYLEKKLRKIQYYSSLPHYKFISLEKSDIVDNFQGLKNKLLEIDPTLKLNTMNIEVELIVQQIDS